jgi:hypothetical protein
MDTCQLQFVTTSTDPTKHTLGAPAHELNAILSELGGNLQKLLNLVGHIGCVFGWKGGRR